MADFKIPSINYTSRDFESTRDDMISLIPFFTSEWTNFNETDFGIVLIELFSYVADVLHFYIDRTALEGFLPTAVTRPSVINLLKLIDFELLGPASATVDLIFTLDTAQAKDLVIPIGTQVSTVPGEQDTPVTFETIDELVIPAGETVGEVGAREGETLEEFLEDSDGTAFQRKQLSSQGIIRESVRLFVDESGTEEEWDEISSLADAVASDKVFEIIRNSDDSLTILLGDNGQGKIPSPGATLRSEFVVGGGVSGNVGAETIRQLNSNILLDGTPVAVNVNNPKAATGGEPEMSIEEAKRLGPKSLKTFDRAVTLDDIETLALQVPGVQRAKSVVKDPVGRVNEVFIAPAGGGDPSNALLTQVENFINPKAIAGTTIEASPPDYVEVDIDAEINVLANFNQDDVKTSVEAAIEDYFDLNNLALDFGTGSRLGDVYALLENVDGVDFVNITKLTVDPLSTVNLQTWTGDASIDVIDVSTNVKDESWTIFFNTPTTFSLTGTVSGTQASIGTVGTTLSTDFNELSILITNTGVPQAPLDRATFRTSTLIGNLSVLDNELRIKGEINLTFVGGV